MKSFNKELKGKLARLAMTVVAIVAALFATTVNVAATDTSIGDSVALINEMLPLIITIMVLSLVLGLIGGLFAGLHFGGGRK